ncbi:hypothetical protein ACQX3E_12330 [Corynebacterium diphtheriae]
MFTNHPNLIGFAAYNNSELDIGVRFELDRHPRTEHLVCLAASTPGLCLVLWARGAHLLSSWTHTDYGIAYTPVVTHFQYDLVNMAFDVIIPGQVVVYLQPGLVRVDVGGRA